MLTRPDTPMFHVASGSLATIQALESKLLARGFQKTIGDLGRPKQYRFWVSSVLEGGSPGEGATLYWREEEPAGGAEESGSEVGAKHL